MRIQTRGNSNVVWLSNGEGVINGTMSLSAPALERILQAVNEKYGTSFEGWSQKPTVYEMGNTVPNWNAYEKIEMLILDVAVEVSPNSGRYCVGRIEGKTYIVNTNSNNEGFSIDNAGEIKGYISPIEGFVQNVFKPKLQSAGYDIQSVEYEIKDWVSGQTIPNINDMTFIA